MHKFDKSPPDLVDRFRRLTADIPDVEPRQMFGYPSVFANGHLATGLMGADWIVRLPEDRRAVLLAEPGAELHAPMGRPMKEYVAFPRDWLDSPERLRPWIDEALAHVRSLPAKERKPRKKRT